MGKCVNSLMILAILCISLVRADFSKTPLHADLLDREISEYHAHVADHMQQDEDSAHQNLKNLKSSNLGAAAFHCTGGQDPSKLSNKDYLTAFRKSTCSPVVVLAGIMGTKMQIVIDCPVLKASHPDIFKDCGWTTCSVTGTYTSFPRTEYTIWIPAIGGPFNIATTFPGSKTCLSHFLALKWEKVGSEYKHATFKGAKIQAMGYSPLTKTRSDCGFEAVSNLLPVFQTLAPPKFGMFNEFKKELLRMGYRLGLTMVALPYDWRFSYSNGDVSRRGVKLVKTMAAISKKPVSLYAHSMGNYNVLYLLSQMTQAEKDKYIHRFYSLAPPYLGSATAVNYLLGGNSDFYFKGFGVPFWMMRQVLMSPAIFDIMPRLVWTNFASQPWMKSILNRMKREKGVGTVDPISPADDIVSKLLPKQTDFCSQVQWKTRERVCLSGFSDFNEVAQVGGQVYTLKNIDQCLKSHSFDNRAYDFYLSERAARDSFDKLNNPGIEVVIMYSNIVRTPLKYIYNVSPVTKTRDEKSDFVNADKMLDDLGDGTVLTTSAITPGIKWASEYDQKKPGAKPITLAEICGSYNKKGFLHEGGDKKNNQYIGVGCNCAPGNESACDHMGVISDSQVISFVTNSLSVTPGTVNDPSPLDSMADAAIATFANNCDLLESLA